MKIWFWLLPLAVMAGVVGWFFLQRWREAKLQREGMVLYATVISLEPVTVFRKPSPVTKINLWVQEPGGLRRDVSISTRIPAGQKFVPGVMLPVVIDRSNPKRVIPANEESVKRAQLTGSREQRRRMKSQGM